MSLPLTIDYAALQEAINPKVIEHYQQKSLLGLFPSVPIPKGIAAETWAQKYITETRRASGHARGFHPNQMKLDFSGFSLTPFTVDQETVLDEVELAQFAETGLLTRHPIEIAQNMAISASMELMMHKDGNGVALPFTDYHYLLADGDGSNGTPSQPIWFHDAATAGAWSTWANIHIDLGNLIDVFGAKGGDLSAALMLAPLSAMPVLNKQRSEYQGSTSVADYIAKRGIPLAYIEDEYFYTQATALPTAALFDLVMVDVTEFVVGYQRPERVISGPAAFPSRNFYIQGEVWFAFLCVPLRKNEAGTVKTYKNATRIRAIVQA